MHVSLDSALGRQRRLNSVGESVLQIAPNAAAAYSLRSLTGGDPKVVRVRRASDNGERDFTSSEITSGEMVSWVNRQVIAPLDIQALEADGRTGDFLIAKAAYALRSLGTRQATITGLDSFPAPFTSVTGKFVVQVRRSSDDTFKSFTADEVTDGTLLAFVGTGGSDNGFVRVWYDQSVTTEAGDTATGNHAVQITAAEQPKIVNAGSLISGGLRFDDAQSLETAGTFSFASGTTLSSFITNKSDGDENAYLLRFVSDYIVYNTAGGIRRVFAGTNANSGTLGSDEELWTTISALNSSGGTANFFADGTLVSSADANIGTNAVSSKVLNIGGSSSGTHWNGTVNEVIFYDTDQTDNRGAIEANIGEAYSITGIPAYDNTVDGFVETWYDQSGNNRPLIQANASEQPLIVEAGTFLNGVKSNKATSNDTMQNLQVSTDGTNANFGTDDWASGASSKLGAVYVGTVPLDSVVSSTARAIIWGGGRGVGSFQEGGVSLSSCQGWH